MSEHQQLDEAAPSDAKYRRVIDEREVFESDEPLEFTPSQEKYIDKLVEAKQHASRKIREQEAELRDFRTRDAKAAEVTQTTKAFVAEHPDFEDEGAAGKRNGELMRMRLAELRLPVTLENLSRAYSHLKASGLLVLKGEEVNAGTDGRGKEPQRIAEPEPTPAPQRMRRTSGITTHNRAVVPVNSEPSEDDAYRMSMGELRELANKQLGARGH